MENISSYLHMKYVKNACFMHVSCALLVRTVETPVSLTLLPRAVFGMLIPLSGVL